MNKEKIINLAPIISGIAMFISLVWIWAYIETNSIKNVYVIGALYNIYIIWLFICYDLGAYSMNAKDKNIKPIMYFGVLSSAVMWEYLLLWTDIKNNYCLFYDARFQIIGSTYEWFVWPVLITVTVFNTIIVLWCINKWFPNLGWE